MEEAMPAKALKKTGNNQNLKKTKPPRVFASEINLKTGKDPAPGTEKKIMDGAAVPIAKTNKL